MAIDPTRNREPITIVLLGPPVAYARTGTNLRQRFTPKRQRSESKTLRTVAQQEMLSANHPIFDEPLRLRVRSEWPIPASWSQRRRDLAILHILKPAKRPDLDNIVKQAKDALSGVVYRDDCLIVELIAEKLYSEQPKIVLTIAPVAAAYRGAGVTTREAAQRVEKLSVADMLGTSADRLHTDERVALPPRRGPRRAIS
jgi:Holliday junction resolvase RusA-like endonuclease